jgi:hypothetical protein
MSRLPLQDDDEGRGMDGFPTLSSNGQTYDHESHTL